MIHPEIRANIKAYLRDYKKGVLPQGEYVAFVNGRFAVSATDQDHLLERLEKRFPNDNAWYTFVGQNLENILDSEELAILQSELATEEELSDSE